MTHEEYFGQCTKYWQRMKNDVMTMKEYIDSNHAKFMEAMSDFQIAAHEANEFIKSHIDVFQDDETATQAAKVMIENFSRFEKYHTNMMKALVN